MAKQQAQGSLFQRLGGRFASDWEEAKQQPVKIGGSSDLPPGLNGIAQLTHIHIGEYQDGDNKGQPFWFARGVVKSPKEFKDTKGNTHYVWGNFTQIIEPMCDTPKSNGRRKLRKDHLAFIRDTLFALGMEHIESVPWQKLEEEWTKLVASKPYFKFRTWQPPSTEIRQANGKWVVYQVDTSREPPREKRLAEFRNEQSAKLQYPFADRGEGQIVQMWGQCVDFKEQEEDVTSHYEDHTGGNGEVVPHGEITPLDEGPEEAPNPEPTTLVKDAEQQQGEEEHGGKSSIDEDGGAFSPMKEEMDLKTLLEVADNPKDSKDRKDARSRLYQMATENGYTSEEVDEADTWKDIFNMACTPKRTVEKNEEPETIVVPEKGKVTMYSSDGGKRRKCVISSVNTDNKTVALKDLTNNTPYKGVKWSELKSE